MPNAIPLYSVCQPATSSESASGRSKGIRSNSASMQMKKTMAPRGCKTMNQVPLWAPTIFMRSREPASKTTPTTESSSGIS